MKNIRKTKKNQVRKRKLSILRGGSNKNTLQEFLRQKLGNRVKASDAWDTTNNNKSGKDWEWRIGDIPKFKVKRLNDEEVTTDNQFLIPFKKNNKNNKYIIYEQKEGDKWVEVKPYEEAKEPKSEVLAKKPTPGKLEPSFSPPPPPPPPPPPAANKYTKENFESLLKEMSHKHHDGILLGKLDENSFNENKFNSNVGKFNLESKTETKVDLNIYDNIKKYVPSDVTLRPNYEEIHQKHHEDIQKFMYADIYSLYNLFVTKNKDLRGIDITKIDGSKYHNKEKITIDNIVEAVTA